MQASRAGVTTGPISPIFAAVSDPNDDWITRKLIAELGTEQFDERDDEHAEVSVGNEHWAVTAQVSGLITFDNMDLANG